MTFSSPVCAQTNDLTAVIELQLIIVKARDITKLLHFASSSVFSVHREHSALSQVNITVVIVHLSFVNGDYFGYYIFIDVNTGFKYVCSIYERYLELLFNR